MLFTLHSMNWSKVPRFVQRVESLSPLLVHFFNVGGPRGTRHKNLQNLDSTQLVGGFDWICCCHSGGSCGGQALNFLLPPVLFQLYDFLSDQRVSQVCRNYYLMMLYSLALNSTTLDLLHSSFNFCAQSLIFSLVNMT
jgi:hypothetical protein